MAHRNQSQAKRAAGDSIGRRAATSGTKSNCNIYNPGRYIEFTVRNLSRDFGGRKAGVILNISYCTMGLEMAH